MDIGECLNQYYTITGDQHAFMYNYLLPEMIAVLEDGMPSLVSNQEQSTLQDSHLNLPSGVYPFNNPILVKEERYFLHKMDMPTYLQPVSKAYIRKRKLKTIDLNKFSHFTKRYMFEKTGINALYMIDCVNHQYFLTEVIFIGSGLTEE